MNRKTPPLEFVSDSERRRYPRRRVRGTSAQFDAPGRLIFAPLYDVSEGGLSTRAPVPFRRGDIIGVKIGHDIAIRARVAWSTAGHEPGMGVEVLELLEGADQFRGMLEPSAPS